MSFDLSAIRSNFPALTRTQDGRPVAWLDGPAGTQVPTAVIEATTEVLSAGVSNHGGDFGASRYGQELTDAARTAAADLMGANPHEIIFGQNMTSLTFAMSRSIGRDWQPGDRVVVTNLDHDANVTPWRNAATEKGAEVVSIEFDAVTGILDPEAVIAAIDERTRLVAVTAASNALGSVTDLAPIIEAARRVGALSYVDAVHFSAHRLSNVATLQPDFLVASAYKFFGPHTGILYGRNEHLERLVPYKVEPSPNTSPDRWETGTQAFESLVAVTAAVDYLASLGDGPTRRDRLESGFAAIANHEDALSTRFLTRLAEIPGVQIYGPDAAGPQRVSTFAVDVSGKSARDVASELGRRGIYVWDGHYYAIGAMDQLGLLESGGLVRIGFVHYTSADEVDRALEALEELAPQL
jgi:cysteine desulfurase family protein (TIGR01976 family)